MSLIAHLDAREVLDSRGWPTVEVELVTEEGVVARAIVPSGASTGQFEALELRDQQGHRFLGKGVQKAIQNIKTKIAPEVEGLPVFSQDVIDQVLIQLDGTPNKSVLGANAILAVSLATAKAAASSLGLPLYRYLGGIFQTALPTPLVNVINGGAHADNGLDIQEFMLVPHGFSSFSEAIRATSEIFHTLKKILKDKNLSTAIGDEGGFAPRLGSNQEALDLLLQAIEKAGYQPGSQVSLALDVASTELFEGKQYTWEGRTVSASGLLEIYGRWLETYPIVSIEDGWAEEDWEGWTAGVKALGHRCQWVGDDLFVTNVKRLQKGIQQNCANALLVKMNQIGTISETALATRMAQRAGWRTIMSHRSGETEDVSLSHLAVGLGCSQIKTGSVCRTDRVAKYNELLRIESDLRGSDWSGLYWGSRAFARVESENAQFIELAAVNQLWEASKSEKVKSKK